jgi:phage terminase large subunit GpA-like protein
MSPQIAPVSKLNPIEQWAREFLKPEDDLPVHQWAAKNFIMDASGPKGLDFYDPLFAPWMNEILDGSADPFIKRITAMCSAQGGKTAAAIIMLGRAIAEDPGPVLWLSSKADSLKQDVKSRIRPSFERSPVIARQLGEGRGDNNVMEMYLKSGVLIKYGSGRSPGDLTGKPIRKLFVDELREWPPGHFGQALKRLRRWKGLSQAFAFSTAGVERDDIHTSFLDGDQRYWYCKCPHCQHEQTLVWQGETADGRYYGVCGIKDDPTAFDSTQEDFESQWDWDKVKKTLRYVCKNCFGTMFVDDPASKAAVTLTGRWIAHKPQVKDHRSYTWNALIDPYGDSLVDLAKEYMMAKYMEDLGIMSYLHDFWKQSMAIPVGDRTEKQKLDNIEIYDPKEPVATGEVLLMTVDCQTLGKFYALILKWQPTGTAKFVACKCCQGWDEVKAFQLEHAVRTRCVFIDCGHWPYEVYAACVRYQEVKLVPVPGQQPKKVILQWRAIKGDGNRTSFIWMIEDSKGNMVKVQKPVSRSEKGDPSMGKKGQGRSGYAEMFYSATNEVKNILQMMILRKTFTIPPGVDPDFHRQMNSERKVKKCFKTVWEKIQGRDNHYWDCASMQVAAAIRANLLKYRAKPEKFETISSPPQPPPLEPENASFEDHQ